jgi:hypothetical protein
VARGMHKKGTKFTPRRRVPTRRIRDADPNDDTHRPERQDQHQGRSISTRAACLVLQLYLCNGAPFVVPILGDPLMPAAPCGPGQNAFDALLRGQHETPQETTYLANTQRHTSPREVLKAVRLLRLEACEIFFNGGAAGRWAARSTVNSAYAHIANVICRYHPVQLRTSY